MYSVMQKRKSFMTSMVLQRLKKEEQVLQETDIFIRVMAVLILGNMQTNFFHRGYLRTLVAGTWAEPLEADLVRLAEAIFAGRELDMNRFYRRGRAEAATVPELVQALRKRVLPGMTYAEALQADDVVYLGDAWAVLAYLGDALGCLDGDRANEVYRLTRLQMEQAGMHGDRGLYEAIMRLEQRCRVVLLSNSYEETVREFLRQLEQDKK